MLREPLEHSGEKWRIRGPTPPHKHFPATPQHAIQLLLVMSQERDASRNVPMSIEGGVSRTIRSRKRDCGLMLSTSGSLWDTTRSPPSSARVAVRQIAEGAEAGYGRRPSRSDGKDAALMANLSERVCSDQYR
jgi:hypothetical protein